MAATSKEDHWKFSFAFGDDDDEDSEDDAQAPACSPLPTAARPEPQTEDRVVAPVLSEDAQLARELDISTREETVTFRKTPWTIAKQNAALRPPPPNPLCSPQDDSDHVKMPELTVSGTTDRRTQPNSSVANHPPQGSSNIRPTSPSTTMNVKVGMKKDATLSSTRNPLPHSAKSAKATGPLNDGLATGSTLEPLRSDDPLYVAIKQTDIGNQPQRAKPAVISANNVHRSAIPGPLKSPAIQYQSLEHRPASSAPTIQPGNPSTQVGGLSDTDEDARPRKVRRLLVASEESKLDKATPKRSPKKHSPRPLIDSTRRIPFKSTPSAYLKEIPGRVTDELWTTLDIKRKTQGRKPLPKKPRTTDPFTLPFILSPPTATRPQILAPQRTTLTLYQPPPPLLSAHPPKLGHREQDRDTKQIYRPGSSARYNEAASHRGATVAFKSPSSLAHSSDPISNESGTSGESEDDIWGRRPFFTADSKCTGGRERMPGLLKALRQHHRTLRRPLYDLLGMKSCGIVWNDKWPADTDQDARISIFEGLRRSE